MKVLIFSDPHLFLDRKAHFTRDSSIRREALSKQTLVTLLDNYRGYFTVCAGDFFNSFSNSETNILESVGLASRMDKILAGNHDHSKRTEVRSSMDVLKHLVPEFVVTEPEAYPVSQTSVFYLVPHQLTQEKFEGVLNGCKKQLKKGYKYYLFVHCNYSPWHEQEEGTLSLSRSQAQELLSAGFNRIFIGHEHAPREDFDGRVVVIGNTYPTGFADLSSKRHLILDPDADELQSVVHWRMEDHYSESPDEPNKLFYDLPAGTDPKKVVELFRGGALGVRLGTSDVVREQRVITRVDKLPDVISHRISQEDPQLEQLWKELAASVEVD